MKRRTARGFTLNLSLAAVLCILINAPGGAAEKAALYASPVGPFDIDAVPTLTLHDPAQKKDLDLRITYPTSAPAGRLPVIVFSHGASGSKDAYAPLVSYWAACGYVVIQPTHGDSIKKLGLRALVNKNEMWKHWKTRPLDIKLILDRFDDIEKKVPALADRLDREKIAMGGHSFGAHTTMAVGGLTFDVPFTGKVQYEDPRPRCLLMISPQGPGGLITEKSYATITRPAMVITGTNDTSIDKHPAAWRLKVFELMPAGDKYQVLIDGAAHGFGGIAGKLRYPSSGPIDQQQVDEVKTAALAFFDAYVRELPAAKAFLASDQLSRATDHTVHLTRK